MSAISDHINKIYLIEFRPEILFGHSKVTAKDYNGISLLKGILLLFVIWGHLLPKGVYGDISAYLIYSFHMPLFLALSGYLIKTKFLKESSFQGIWSKYAKQLLLFWAIAWIVYASLEHIVFGRFTTTTELLYFLFFPDLHLWYVPALIGYINILYIFKKLGWADWKILLLSFVVSILTVYNFEYVHVWTDWYQTIPGGIYRTYRPQYFFFFVLGYSIKEFKFKKNTANYLKLLLPILIGIRILNFYLPELNRPFFTWDFFMLNMLLIVLVLPYFQNNAQFEYHLKIYPVLRWFYYPFMWMGINSLHIYLWHALGKYILFNLI